MNAAEVERRPGTGGQGRGADPAASEGGSPVGCGGRWLPQVKEVLNQKLDGWQADRMRREEQAVSGVTGQGGHRCGRRQQHYHAAKGGWGPTEVLNATTKNLVSISWIVLRAGCIDSQLTRTRPCPCLGLEPACPTCDPWVTHGPGRL